MEAEGLTNSSAFFFSAVVRVTAPIDSSLAVKAFMTLVRMEYHAVVVVVVYCVCESECESKW